MLHNFLYGHSKILLRRLVELARKILHLAQVTFVRSCSIVDNIDLAQELPRRYTRKRISLRCILKTFRRPLIQSARIPSLGAIRFGVLTTIHYLDHGMCYIILSFN